MMLQTRPRASCHRAVRRVEPSLVVRVTRGRMAAAPATGALRAVADHRRRVAQRQHRRTRGSARPIHDAAGPLPGHSSTTSAWGRWTVRRACGTGQMRELRLALYRHTGERSALLIGMPLIDPSGLYLASTPWCSTCRAGRTTRRWSHTRATCRRNWSRARARRACCATSTPSRILSHDLRTPLRHARGYLRLTRSADRWMTRCSGVHAVGDADHRRPNGMIDALLFHPPVARAGGCAGRAAGAAGAGPAGCI